VDAKCRAMDGSRSRKPDREQKSRHQPRNRRRSARPRSTNDTRHWMRRRLARARVGGTGVDVGPSLIDQAASAGGGEFRVASYEDIADGILDIKVDAVVANFSLIGNESVNGVIHRVPSLLEKYGALIIQTLHPLAATGDLPYEDGWRHGSWAGFSSDFSDPAPWYFRTVETWKALIRESGFTSIDVREPLHPATGKPASIIFIAS
jgi:hypothetical protein